MPSSKGSISSPGTISGNNYTVGFSSQGLSGATPTAIQVYTPTLKDAGATLPTPTLASGKTFGGWFTEPSGGTQVTDTTDLSSLAVSGSVTLYAQEKTTVYTVGFKMPGAETAPTSVQVTGLTFKDASKTLPTPTLASGETFGGWFTAASGGTQVTDTTDLSSLAVNGAVTLYAQEKTALVTPTAPAQPVVIPPPAFTSDDQTTVDAGTPGTFTVSADSSSSAGQVGYELGHSAPAWATINDATGVMSIDPPVSASGPYVFNIYAYNNYQTAVELFTVDVDHAPAVAGRRTLGWRTLGWRAGQHKSVTWVATGFPDATLSLSGDLPAGMTWKAVGNRLAVWGAPWVPSGSHHLTVTTTNQFGTVSVPVTLVVW